MVETTSSWTTATRPLEKGIPKDIPREVYNHAWIYGVRGVQKGQHKKPKKRTSGRAGLYLDGAGQDGEDDDDEDD